MLEKDEEYLKLFAKEFKDYDFDDLEEVLEGCKGSMEVMTNEEGLLRKERVNGR